jgi:phenylpyruvate tautomerase PptA (4-oxalocrotonate tautomerase family)
MRQGRTDEQSRKLASGLVRVISKATGEPKDNIVFVIREGAESTWSSTASSCWNTSRARRATRALLRS